MKIAFLSARGVWPGGWGGGTEHFLVQALERRGHDVSVLHCPSSAAHPSGNLSHRMRSMVRKLVPAHTVELWADLATTGIGQAALRRLVRKRRNPAWATSALVAYGQYFSPAVNALAPDVVVSMDNRVVAYLNTTRPIVVWGDAVFDALLDFYPRFSNLCEQTIQEGRDAEERQFAKAALVVYSSQWAVAAAKRFHNVPAERLAFIPYGANFEPAQAGEEVAVAIGDRSRDLCRLVFICSEWHRKGGAHVLRLHERLKRSGLACALTILGHYPQRATRIAGVTCIPFIQKAESNGQRAMIELLRQHHFLLLPASADCTPMVVAEANSCGVPVLASDVGGIPSLIETGVTGFYSALDRFEEEASRFVVKAFHDYDDVYWPLASRAHEHYQRRLNWDVAARQLSDVIAERVLSNVAS